MPLQTVRGFPTDALALRLRHRRLNRRSNVSSDFVLHSKYVSEIAVISLRPEMGAGCRFDELCSEFERGYPPYGRCLRERTARQVRGRFA